MKKLIELDAAIEAMAELQGRAASKGELTGISKAWKRIKALPFVDAVPVRHGHWILHENADIVDGYYVPDYECSVCHALKQDDSDYFPDCGSLNDRKNGDHENN